MTQPTTNTYTTRSKLRYVTRILILGLCLLTIAVDTALFALLAGGVLGLEKGVLAGLIVGAFALWVTFAGVARARHKIAYELMLNAALAFMAFRAVSDAILGSRAKSGLSDWETFYALLTDSPGHWRVAFIAIWLFGRLLIWAVKEMQHDSPSY